MGYRREIIIGVINMIFNNIFGRRIALMKPITDVDVMVCVIFAIGYFVCITLFNMLLIKIGEVNKSSKEMSS